MLYVSDDEVHDTSSEGTDNETYDTIEDSVFGFFNFAGITRRCHVANATNNNDDHSYNANYADDHVDVDRTEEAVLGEAEMVADQFLAARGGEVDREADEKEADRIKDDVEEGQDVVADDLREGLLDADFRFIVCSGANSEGDVFGGEALLFGRLFALKRVFVFFGVGHIISLNECVPAR